MRTQLLIFLVLLLVTNLGFAKNRTVYNAEMDPTTRVICTNQKQMWEKGELHRDDFGTVTFTHPEEVYQVIGKLTDGENSPLLFTVQNFVTDRVIQIATAKKQISNRVVRYQNGEEFLLETFPETRDRGISVDAYLVTTEAQIALNCYNPRDLDIHKK